MQGQETRVQTLRLMAGGQAGLGDLRGLLGRLPRPVPGAVGTALAERRGTLLLFVPVLMGLGIWGYFAWPQEPTAAQWAALGASAAVAAAGARLLPESARLLSGALVVVALGAGLAGMRAHLVAAPVLGWHYYGAIEGRVVMIDRSGSDAVRLTLDQVVLERIRAERTPARVRVSLHGQQGFIDPVPGLRVILTGHLGPPPAPSEPGGFDFRRMAWFDRLGAVGYTRTPVLTLAPADEGRAGLAVHRLRMTMSRAVRDRIPGDAGGFVAAILTGDRSGISQAATEDLRRANLAHLLAISGLHMGLLTGFVFGALRLVMALIPPLALRLPTRKLAAVGALGAGAFYLMLSGGNVATQRAFVMVAVMLLAVLLDRRAVSLRSVAIAAILILTFRPEALLSAGFQMSFAATIALVAVFRALRHERDFRMRLPRRAWPVVSLVICSVVAGLATAPFAAAHFNRVAEYGLLANLLAVPLMGSVIIPAAVLAAVLTPLGLQGAGLAVMDWGARWILAVSAWIAGLDGAVTPVVQPHPAVLPMLVLGALWVLLWPGWWRAPGLVALPLALLLWAQSPRPEVLISDDAALVGVLGDTGRVLSRPRSAGFAASAWLQADGDGADQVTAFARRFAPEDEGIAVFRSSAGEIVHLSGRRARAALADACLPGRLVVISVRVEAADRPEGCDLHDPDDMAATGARALIDTRQGPRWVDVAQRAGRRPWTR